jgi:hypothetical protein
MIISIQFLSFSYGLRISCSVSHPSVSCLVVVVPGTGGVLFGCLFVFFLKEFLSSMDPMKLFSPTREAQFRELRDLPVEEFTRNRVQYFLMNLDGNNDRLNLERKKLTNGDRKRDMTNWWLTHIEESVDQFLEALGYKHDAVPRDYLAKPPRNLHEVEKNLKIVATCLDRAADVYGVQEYVSKVG